MSGPGSPLSLAGWLALREPADAEARSTDLAARAGAHLAATGFDSPGFDSPGSDSPGFDSAHRPVVRDLGAGTGSMARWLSPVLPGPVRWVLQDADPAVLSHAAVPGARTVAAGVGELTAADLAGTSLVTASALLDLLTATELDALVTACAGARCPALLTLTVTGGVRIDPPDPLDGAVAAAFDAHQRRDRHRRGTRFGPDAAGYAAAAFGAHGTVHTRPSPWRLGPAHPELTAEWLRGRVAAAAEQDPGLPAAGYLDERLRALDDGRVTAEIGHADLLFLPAGGRS